jgi:type IV pilus assembly protein PilQ
LLAATPDAPAGLNTVNKLDVEEAAKGTTIRIRGSSVPTFSVFKLADPPRLFVDISNSQLSSDGAPHHINNGVISQVAMLSVRDATQSVTRVIIGFERAAHYDVRTEGNDVVVFIDGSGRRQAPAVSVIQDDKALRSAQAELAATQERLQRADAELASTRAKLQSADGELAALRTRIASSSGDEKARLERERIELDKRIQALRREERASAQRAEQAEQAATIAQKKAEQAEARAQAAQKMAEESERLARLQAEKAQKAEQRAQDSTALAAKLQSSLDATSAEKAKLERSLTQTQMQAREAARALEARNAELEAARARSAELERQIAALRARAEGGDSKASKELAALEAERRTLSDNLDKTRRALEDAEARSRVANAQLATLERDLQSRDAELVHLRAEVASLRAAKAEREQRPAARAVPVDAVTSNAVRDIRLETVNGRSRIIVELERPGHFETLPGKNSRAVMILNNTTLPSKLEKTLRTRAEGGAVRFVSSFADRGQVRMEAELDGKTLETVRQDGSTLVWEFAPLVADAGRTPQIDEDPQPAQGGESFTSAPPAVITDPSKQTGVPGMGKKRLSIDLREADIQNVLRLIAKEGGVNIIAGDDVKGTVTMRLRSVPLDQVFLTILQSKSLGYEVRGNVIRVAPQETLLKEEAARAEAKAASQRLRPLEVFLLPVNYATADELVPQVQGLLSKRGTVSVDARTNMLIIKDLPENLNSVRALVENLDAQVPQVLIEARIVETNDTFQQQLGIQWGGDLTFSQANGNPTGLIFPSVLGLAGAAADGQTPREGLPPGTPPNFAVNLPAPIGTGSGGGIGLSMGSLGGAFNLSVRLSALEQAGSARIISAPKILTLDNRQASISQGTSIPISVVGAAGVQTVFVDATLQLTVTPHVTPDGNIRLLIQATKNEPDFQNTGARGDPTIIRRQARTELLIKDGDTTVIGGIYTRNSGTSMSAVPFFHKIPILGFFFRNSSESERRNELLIFITPKIVNRAEALGAASGGSITEDAPAAKSGNSSNN